MCIFLPLMPGIPGCRTVVLQEHTDRFMAEPSDQQELYAHRETVDHIEVLITEAEKYFRSEPARLQELADEILSLSTPINYNRGIAYGEYYTGRVLYLHSEFEKALVYHTTALQSFENVGDNQGVLSSLRQVGVTYQMLCQYDKALECYNRELSIQQQVDNKTGIAATLANIATVYLLIGQQDIALESYLRALSVIESLGEDHALLIIVLGNIANLYMSLDEYEEALTYQEQVLHICQKRNDINGETLILVNIGWNYLQSKQFELALDYEFRALQVVEQTGDKKLKGNILLHIGLAYTGLGKYTEVLHYLQQSYELSDKAGDKRTNAAIFKAMGDLFLITGEKEQANKYYKNALMIAEEIHLQQTEYELHELIAHVEEDSGNVSEALAHFREYIRIKEEVIDERRRQSISEMQIRFHVEQSDKEKEIYRLKNVELADALQKVGALNTHLSEANSEKNELLGIVAHDLKNPISGLSLSLSMLNNYLSRMSQEEISRQISQMNKTVQRMEEIVAKLLDINIIDSGKLVLQPIVFNINEAVRAIVEDYGDRLRDKSIIVKLELIDDVISVYADKGATLEVLDNLISNAVKYSPPYTEITINTTIIDEKARVTIKDCGPGIDIEDFDKLFKKFVRLRARPTGGESSTGLGLSIVKKLVDAMNGQVWCEPHSGEGAIFAVALPLMESKAGDN